MGAQVIWLIATNKTASDAFRRTLSDYSDKTCAEWMDQ